MTEMEYQHLVFEEFARKVQPAVRLFHVYSPDISPAVEAEFAHAVYRFGHSMLDDDVARTTTNADGSKTDNSVPLLTAFLNPPEFFNNGQGGFYTPQQAGGAIVMGSSDQVGNELDEFVVETLRNNLLGLPLDLPTLNMTRARDAGIPPLNELRRQIHAETNDGQLAPYTSWTDFGQHLKHPASLINFVAAYGTHPTIRDSGPDGILGGAGAADDVTTIAAKRAAARAIVDPLPTDVPPADAAEFMFSIACADNSCDWSSDANGVTTTGLDKVDLWVGGLAETTNLFGGLLGSTFNYVFQSQLEKLQDGDRFYYLARTPGMNLRTQLEGNSFSELIQRNTDDTNSLKADAFATADCKFQLANLAGTPAGFTSFGGNVADDLTTECKENLLLLRMPDGTIQYRARNTVDPVGINGQAVYNGTSGLDRIYGGNDNDTFWGGAGNDIIEGNGGDDVALGGMGNDIITDLDGADVPKGGPGNDAIDAGPGDDIPMGGDGQDFINGGSNDNETFAGPDNDFIIAGQGADAVFGDGGNDWIEGGSGQDLLQGDHSAPFFDDPGQVAPGNDIFVGQVGENDYDAEGGDDLMSQNAAVDRNAGAAGFDWAFHQYDTVGANDDMEINNNLVGVPIQVVVNRDRWQETEADSGSAFNDIIRGTVTAPNAVGGAGFSGCDVLDQAGVDRIHGLSAIVPQPLTESSALVVANSAAGFCPVNGPVFGAGDILIGGLGSDTIEGRGADDIIDGDRYLTVRISYRSDPANPATEIGSTDLMENRAVSGSWGLGSTPTMTLQQAVFRGIVDPGKLVAVREIQTPVVPADCGTATPVNCDTAVFSGLINSYVITHNSNGSVTVDSQGGADGIDTVWNTEKLAFADTTIDTPSATVNAPPVGTVTLSTLTPTEGIALTATPAFTDANGINLPTLTLTWELELSPGVWGGAGVLGQTFTPGNFEVGHALRVVATYLDNDGFPETVISAATAPVINVNDVPVGAPALTDLTPTEGDVLTAATSSIADADGLPATFNFQWQQSANGGGGAFTNIAGAPNSANFTPAQAQVNRALRVVVSYTDLHGTLETLTSPVTGVTGDLFIGGPGADNFTGTAGEDHIFGRGGNDTLNGANGNDIIAGEAGNDTINGGNGDDTVQFTGTGDGFDAVTGAAGNDQIVPTTANTNVGLTSIATIELITNNGFAGLHIVGSGNADTLNFTAVTLTGVVNIDGGGGNDTLTGSQNADVMLGGAGNDTLNGGNGNDTLIGNAGNDTLNGQGDNDTFQFAGTGNGFDAVTGAAGTDRVEATSNNTDIGLSSIATVEQVSANSFLNVHVVGTANADTLNFSAVTFTGVIDIDGAAGADTLTGSAASDTIIGGAGNDNVTPGTGNDRLRYAAGFGQDTVTGFDSNPTGGQDKLDIQALGITAATFNASVVITNVGGNTRIQIGANRITLNGVAAATVDATDFDLAGAPLSPLSLSGSSSLTAGARVAFKVSSPARLLSVGSGKWGAVKARFVFAPKGFKFHGAKTIVMARDANGHIVLKVQAKGSVKHGYKVRIVGGGTALQVAQAPWQARRPRRGAQRQGAFPLSPRSTDRRIEKPDRETLAETRDMHQQRPHLRTAAATYAIGVGAAAGASLTKAVRRSTAAALTAAVLLACAASGNSRCPRIPGVEHAGQWHEPRPRSEGREPAVQRGGLARAHAHQDFRRERQRAPWRSCHSGAIPEGLYASRSRTSRRVRTASPTPRSRSSTSTRPRGPSSSAPAPRRRRSPRRPRPPRRRA